MLSRQYSLILLATTLFATLQSQSSFAVTVNNPLGRPVIMPYEDSIKQKSGLVQLQAWPFYDPRSVLDFAYLHTQLFNPLGRQGKPKAAPKLEN